MVRSFILFTGFIFLSGWLVPESRNSSAPPAIHCFDSNVRDSMILAEFMAWKPERVRCFDSSFFLPDNMVRKYRVKGLEFFLPHKKADQMRDSLYWKMAAHTYFTYLSEQEVNQRIRVVKTMDQFDILRLEQTAAPNYDITTEQVISQLTLWQKKLGLLVIGAGEDWVDMRITRMPADMAEFSKEVYAFCPDVVDQGTGTVEKLTVEMDLNRRVFLWWD